jgi:ABC-2 type transport system ATP-binding protein
MIEASGLTKSFGKTIALAGIDLQVPVGSILGFLGPNGAGKTTAIRILATLSLPDKGSARVAGFDVVGQASEVRRNIGVAAQDATLDDNLTGRQNLVMFGVLNGFHQPNATGRAKELLEQVELADSADRLVKTYSGGMRRRLDLAAAMVASPPVMFLDEPTTGLDPTVRQRMWNIIRGLVAEGVTALLTTQYLEEADALADQIAVIDHGKIIAQGTPAKLKAATGSAVLEVTLSEQQHNDVDKILKPFVEGPINTSQDGRRLRAPVRSSAGLATTIVRALDSAGVMVDDVEVHQPSLDDVFFSLTGHPSTNSNASQSKGDLR